MEVNDKEGLFILCQVDVADALFAHCGEGRSVGVPGILVVG